jgi:3',5'-cyclic AMP phosphodiesterase CpdA
VIRLASLHGVLYLDAMRILTLALLTLMLAQSAHAQISDKKLHEPTPMPDRIVLTWHDDPTRTQAVTWRTDTTVTKAMAEIARATGGPEFQRPDGVTSVPAVTTPFKSDLGEALLHSVRFEGLKPGAKYAYRVGARDHWSEWNHFQTASEKPEKFTFLYFGDAQYLLRDHWSRVMREAYAAAPRARFAIHAGDLVNNSARDAEWGEWFQAVDWIHRTVPVVPTPGNHEHREDDGKTLSRYWNVQFALPEHGPKGLKGTVFFVDFQGVRIVCLNSNEKLQEQAAWLEEKLANNPNRWTIVTFHHPIFSSAQGRDNPTMRKLWHPLFEKHKVDLVLQGHDHCYGRSGLERGAVYVVSVSGPMFYPVDETRWMVRRGEKIQLFQAITIDGNRLSFEARTATGEVFDSFELEKQEGGPNVLRDGAHDPRSVPRSSIGAASWIAVGTIVVLVGILIVLRLLRNRGRGA